MSFPRPKIRTGGSFVCFMFDFTMLLNQYSKYFLQMTFVKFHYSNNT